jgi:hypothetical protein
MRVLDGARAEQQRAFLWFDCQLKRSARPEKQDKKKPSRCGEGLKGSDEIEFRKGPEETTWKRVERCCGRLRAF